MSLLVPVHVDTFTGTWGAINNGFGADMAFQVCRPPDPMEEFIARFDGRVGPHAAYEWHGIDYPAQGFGINSTLSMDESCAVALENGVAEIQSTPPGTKHVISGYSQGAICAYLLAHEFLPGKRIDRLDDLLMVINFGDPTCPEGFYPDGFGITRYEWDPRLKVRLLSYDNPADMYGRAPVDTYLHIGFLALKQLKLDFLSLIQLMLSMIQNDEFVDALVELLDPLTPGLLDTVVELTGLSHQDAQTKIDNKAPVTGGILGTVLHSGTAGLGGLLGAIPIVGMGTGFLGGFLSNVGLGQFGQITGGLLGGGSGKGGTNAGWVKMGKTFGSLMNFGVTGDHGRYWDPTRANWNGRTAVDHAVDGLWRLGAHL